MKNKIVRLLLILSVLCTSLFFGYFVEVFVMSNSYIPKNSKNIGLFSWDVLQNETDVNQILKLMDKLHITRIYHEFKDDYESFNLDLLTKVNSKNKEVFSLFGKPNWGLDANATDIKNEIDKVIAPIKGIVIDVEPYLLPTWNKNTEEILYTYSESMQEAYRYAKDKNLYVILCIPNWYDEIDSKIVEDLIAHACDEISVMNYNKSIEIEAIRNEVIFAEKYNKPIECIFEFQDVGTHNLKEDQTYANDGIAIAIKNFNKLYQTYDYQKLYFAYHYAQPLMKMIK